MATNVIVRPKRNESPERLIKRFIRKCKKEKVIEKYRERTDHFIKPSVKRKLKRRKAIREQEKAERKRDKKLFR
jgi:ribosomal protein S21